MHEKNKLVRSNRNKTPFGWKILGSIDSRSWFTCCAICAAAKAAGAAKITVCDILESRLSVATTLGATNIIHISDKQSIDSEIECGKIERPDVTIEASGSANGISSAIKATKSGGVVVLVGLGPSEVTLPIVDAKPNPKNEAIKKRLKLRSTNKNKCYWIKINFIQYKNNKVKHNVE